MFNLNYDKCLEYISACSRSNYGAPITDVYSYNNEMFLLNYAKQFVSPSDRSNEYNILRLDSFGDASYNINTSKNYLYLWCGGDIVFPEGSDKTQHYNPKSDISMNKVSYYDYNFHRIFYGGVQPGSWEIYGQKHIVSGLKYNAEKKAFQRTITREFKNTSGGKLIVKEIGLWYEEIMLSREILDVPIEVEDDCYFKISYTYDISNIALNDYGHEETVLSRPIASSVADYTNANNHSFIISTLDTKALTPNTDIMLLRVGISIYGKAEYPYVPPKAPGWDISLLDYSVYNQNYDRNITSSESSIINIILLCKKKQDMSDYSIDFSNYKYVGHNYSFTYNIRYFNSNYVQDVKLISAINYNEAKDCPNGNIELSHEKNKTYLDIIDYYRSRDTNPATAHNYLTISDDTVHTNVKLLWKAPSQPSSYFTRLIDPCLGRIALYNAIPDEAGVDNIIYHISGYYDRYKSRIWAMQLELIMKQDSTGNPMPAWFWDPANAK